MPVTVTTGQVISAGDTVTAQTLHDMVENATVTGITGGDGSGQEVFLVAQAAAPNPTNNPFWYDTSNAQDHVGKVYALPWNAWITFGPDRVEIPLLNFSGGTIHKGALVVASGASSFGVASGPSANVLGFTQDTAVSGAAVGVGIFGICWVAWGSAHSGFHLNVTPAHLVVAHHTTAGFASASAQATDLWYGIWIDQQGNTNFPSQHGAIGRAYIHGPLRDTSPL